MNIVESTIYNSLRAIAFVFDNVTYTLINYCYKLLLYLANIDLSEFGGVETLVSRIYILLGIFMLFKLAFSIIQYVVTPDSFTDSGKGFGKLATNVMVAMVLLVATPWMFNALYEAQGYILESNVIGRLVMGSNTAGDTDQKMSVDKISSMANDTEFLLYGAFASLNTNKITECEGANIMGTTQQVTINDGKCLDTLNEKFNGDNLKEHDINLHDFFKYQENGETKDERDFSAFSKLIIWQEDGEYMINYIPIISALVGGYVAFLLVFYCIDVALRAVKLLFLQMVAPISIISYIDPKESISNSKLANWIKEVFKTWASLFIRLLVIFLVMQLVSIIATGVFGDGTMINNGSININSESQPEGITKAFVYVLLVVGCFQFAKKVPELIEGLFGIKMSGDLRIGQTLGSFGGATIAGGIGSAFGAAGALAASRDNKLGFGTTALNTARGFASGGARSAISGAKSGDKGIGTWSQIGRSAAGRNSRAVDIRGTTTAMGRAGARTRNALGMQSKKESLDSRLETYNSVVNGVKGMEERAKSQLAAKSNEWKIIQAQRNKLNQDYNNGKAITATAGEKAEIEKAYRKKNGCETGTLTSKQQAELNSMFTNQDIIYAQRLKQMNDAEDKMVKEYINTNGQSVNGKDNPDKEIERNKTQLQRITDENDFTVKDKKLDTNDWSNIKEFKTEYDNKAKDLKASNEYEDAGKYDQYVKSSVGQKHMNG